MHTTTLSTLFLTALLPLAANAAPAATNVPAALSSVESALSAAGIKTTLSTVTTKASTTETLKATINKRQLSVPASVLGASFPASELLGEATGVPEKRQLSVPASVLGASFPASELLGEATGVPERKRQLTSAIPVNVVVGPNGFASESTATSDFPTAPTVIGTAVPTSA